MSTCIDRRGESCIEVDFDLLCFLLDLFELRGTGSPLDGNVPPPTENGLPNSAPLAAAPPISVRRRERAERGNRLGGSGLLPLQTAELGAQVPGDPRGQLHRPSPAAPRTNN
eukprot:CAMPEP_0173173098 /NCGR_PEP_ID=MMETSP1141-20130122/2656_1 /TAXON_ID=483371 /ORGANISM="non described non described, Strain CCMP2298" /LENGTH=111 /DNA_ID=CAMNT_0014095169 /DNA_START=524 /DNA_END=859 /DNA_ORIENTATION=+